MTKWVTSGYHGFDCSEHNHSSLLVQLDGGHRRESQYFKYPHTLVNDLLHHEHTNLNNWNNLLHDKNMQIDVRTEQFNDRTPQCTHEASTVLSIKSLLMFENRVQRIVDYQVDYISDLHASVISKSHTNVPLKIFYRKPPNEYFHVVYVKFHVRMNRNCLIP